MFILLIDSIARFVGLGGPQQPHGGAPIKAETKTKERETDRFDGEEGKEKPHKPSPIEKWFGDICNSFLGFFGIKPPPPTKPKQSFQRELAVG